jgi:endoglucanase
VYMSDKATFDAFWQYVQSHISNGLMSWQITSAGAPNGNGGVNSAADADEDMAWALIMADKQWPGGSYLTSAKSLLSNIKSQEINGSNNVKDGNFNNAGSSHPDYAAPDYYKVFATVSGDSSWNAVYTAEYAQLTGAQNGSTGLIPDAIGGGTFGYDACRAPWRVGVDYLWNAAPSAKTFLTPMETYFISTVASGNVMNIKLTIPVGGGTGTDVTGAITGPAAVGAMYSASNQQFIDNSYNYLSTVVTNATAGGAGLNYFSGTLGLLATLTLAGDFVDYTNPPP